MHNRTFSEFGGTALFSLLIAIFRELRINLWLINQIMQLINRWIPLADRLTPLLNRLMPLINRLEPSMNRNCKKWLDSHGSKESVFYSWTSHVWRGDRGGLGVVTWHPLSLPSPWLDYLQISTDFPIVFFHIWIAYESSREELTRQVVITFGAATFRLCVVGVWGYFNFENTVAFSGGKTAGGNRTKHAESFQILHG